MNKETPIFINCKDRLSFLRRLLERLIQQGYWNIFLIDTGSTFRPMKQWLALKEFPTIFVPGDAVPHCAIWNHNVVEQFGFQGQYFVYTDCDVVPDNVCPHNWIDELYRVLEKHADFSKAGLGLKTDDLPDSFSRKQEVISWEAKFYQKELEPNVYDSEIDTTLALYKPQTGYVTRAIRTGGTFMARHLPWYSNSDSLTQEERHYKDHMVDGVGHWR